MAFVILCIGALFLRNHIFQATIQQEREQQILSVMREGQRNLSQLQLTVENNPEDTVAKEKIFEWGKSSIHFMMCVKHFLQGIGNRSSRLKIFFNTASGL